jgi:hypothetical protein
LDWLLRNTTHCLTSWSDRFIGNIRLQLELDKEVIHKFEVARDMHQLQPHEEELCLSLKAKSLGLASLQHSVAHQESRLLWLSEGDALTKFLHIHANTHRRKKFVRCIEHDGETLFAKERKAEAFHSYFDNILGYSLVRSHMIHLDLLDLPQLDASCLTSRFIEDEVWLVIRALPPDKAPGLNGFTTRFLQTTWPITRADLKRAFDAFGT